MSIYCAREFSALDIQTIGELIAPASRSQTLQPMPMGVGTSESLRSRPLEYASRSA